MHSGFVQLSETNVFNDRIISREKYFLNTLAKRPWILER